MLKKHFIYYFFVIYSCYANAQSIKQNLLSANAFRYNQKIYVYGYEQNKTELNFKCFSYTKTLQLKDSISYKLGKHTPAAYVDISVDSLHEVLNFYFQLANQKNTVSLLRCDSVLHKICSADNFDANHVNALSIFDDEKYYYKNSLYIIRSVDSDTVGNQFYLTKTTIKSITKPFEYDYNWQFAFERKHIHRATIIYADTTEVVVYANVSGGIKKGQWILRINASKGTLIKGTKLNPKSDARHFLYSNSIYNSQTKSIDVIGSIYEPGMIDFVAKTSNFTNQAKAHKLFLISIDSIGSVEQRVEKPMALPIQTKTPDGLKSFHVKAREFTKAPDNSFLVGLDMYEMSMANTLTYYASWQVSFVPNDVDYELKQTKLTLPLKVFPTLISYQNGDAYGKVYLKDMSEYDNFKYKPSKNSVVIKTEVDDLGQTSYVFKKINILNSSKTFNYLFTGKKGLENKIIFQSEQGQKAQLFFVDKTKYLSFITNIADSEFELKLNEL